MDREKVIEDNAVRGLQSAIEISGALVHLRKEHAKAILALLKSQQAEIERLCNKIGVMKESIEDAIMSETVFDTFDDLSSYVNAERCRSEEWTGGIRDAIQAVRAWGE